MLKYVICLSLASAALVQAVPSGGRRVPRSIWPFTWGTSTESVLSPEHSKMLEQAGLDKTFDLSSHPLWKIHKYQGLDLKPVHVQTEIVGTQQLDARAVSTTETPETPETTPLPEASFLDDLSTLAYILPLYLSPGDNSLDEATDEIADAMRTEEEEKPGFLRMLWSKIWGAPAPVASTNSTGGFLSYLGLGGSAVTEEKKQDDDPLTIYLPETQGNYVAVVVPEQPQQQNRPIYQAAEKSFEEVPSSQSSTAASEPSTTVKKSSPATTVGTEFSRTNAWVQSPQPISSTSPAPESSSPDTYQRKMSQEGEEANSTLGAAEIREKIAEPEEVQVVEPIATTQDPKQQILETAKDLLAKFNIPEALIKKLQVKQEDVDAILNDKETAARAAARLRSLQSEFEMRKQQLSYAYPTLRKQLPKSQSVD